MSSFRRITDTNNTLPGAKVKNNLALISSGIPSLDHILGGGLHASTIFLAEDDILGNYGRVLGKYFLSEGVLSKHGLLIASADEDAKDIVNELPAPCVPSANDEKSNIESMSKMQIAWRYENLNPVDSSFGTNSNWGHNFDLSKYIEKELVDNCDVEYWKPQEEYLNVTGFDNPMYLDLLKNIKQLLDKEQYGTSSKGSKNILRIYIHNLGSPIWLTSDKNDSANADLLKFMYSLRVILKDTNGVAFITMPSHLFENETLIKRVLYNVDVAVKLESFAGSSRETNPAFKDYNGLFHVTKLSAINTLMPYIPPALDLAFKLRRKKFIIEKLHLPPELQESSEREQDDITTAPLTCGGFKKKDVDF